MKVMVIGKASKDSEAGVMAPEEKWREMGEFNVSQGPCESIILP
jgi:hypothetical protein